jgi:NADH:ubiquinone oxidoreductase subunit K
MEFKINMLFAFALFAIGIYGVGSRRDFLRVFFSLEMILNSIILMLSLSANYLRLTQNIELAYMIIVLATIEAGAGLLIFGATYKLTRELSPDNLKGDR